MRELKIDPEFRDLLPLLSGEEKKQLEDSLLKTGYIGAPIYIWNDYIVDGHNRYDLCRKNKIDYPVEDLMLGENATKIDVMEWMINTQLGRRNLPPAQRMAVINKFKDKIQERAKFAQGTRTDLTSSPVGEKVIGIHTDKELAMIAGVKGGRTSKELKKISQIARKYFIAFYNLLSESQICDTLQYNMGRIGFRPILTDQNDSRIEK